MKLDSKVRVIPLMVFCVMGFLSLFSVKGSDVFEITRNSSHQYIPAIYENIVVWQDDRNGNMDIYGYNMSTHEEFPICTDPHDQWDPAIYGDIVVWQDERSDSTKIYGYNLSTQKEFPVTKHPSYQCNPAIYGDIVVWQDRRNSSLGNSLGNDDIYGYNLSTEQEFQITTDTSDQCYPAIYGDIIVWLDERNFIGAIYGYNLSTKEEFQITNENMTAGWPYPVIYADTVVWGTTTSDSMVIDGYNISESRKFRVFRDFVWKCTGWSMEGMRLALYEDLVLWVYYEDCNRDIHGYNLSTHQEFIVASGKDEQYWPAIYGDIVVWICEKDGETNIYGRNLSSGVDPVFLSYRMMVIFVCCSFVILAVFPTVISVCIKPYVGRIISERMVTSEKPRDFRRSDNPLIYVIFAVLSFFLGLRTIVNTFYGRIVNSSDLFWLIFGLFLAVITGLLVYLAFWLKRTPFVRITNDEIIIFESRTSKKVIKWRNIQDIDFKDNKVELISSSDMKFTIFLDRVDTRDKEALIEALKHPLEVPSYP